MATLEEALLDPSVTAASLNYEAQVALIDSLREVFEKSGRSVAVCAKELGVSVEKFEEILTAQWDLTLTEIRLLAIVLNVRVGYTVEPA